MIIALYFLPIFIGANMEYKTEQETLQFNDISFLYNSGWISLHRKIMDKAFFKKPNYLAVWIFLLLKANHSDKEFMFNNEVMIVKRGDLITSKKGISDFFKISLGTVQNILKHFETENQIITKSNNKFTYISITNYDDYQVSYNQNCKPAINNVKTNCKPAITNNNDNNNNKENNVIKEIVSYLNLKTEKNFKDNSKKTISLIKTRLDEKFTLEDFKKVIDKKVTDWKNDFKMDKYLRPETLFSPKFESYLNELDIKQTQNNEIYEVKGASYD